MHLPNFFFEGLYSQKIKTLKNLKIKKTRKLKSLMEEEIPSGTNTKLITILPKERKSK